MVKHKDVIKYDNITPAQVDLIKSQIAVGATDDELKLFLHVADKSGLDPLSKQIYFIKRSGKMTIQTAIDGFRSIADRTGQYVGSSDPIFEGKGEKPDKATVTVNKVVQGVMGSFTASARWSEYYPGKGQGFMWDKMPHTMLGKCAEALALRKAFPAQLSGLYTGDEMAQAGNEGIPNTKTIDPKAGSKGLEKVLTAPEPEPVEESDDTHISLMSDDSLEDEAFERENESGYMRKGIVEKIKDIVQFDIEKVSQDEQEDHLLNKQHLYDEMVRYVKDGNPNWEKDLTEEDYKYIQNYCREVRSVYRPEA